MDNDLLYVPIWGYNQGQINNLIYFILTLEYPYEPAFINDVLQIKVILQNDDDIDDGQHIIISDTTYDHYKGQFFLVIIYHSKATFKDYAQMASNFICLPFGSNFKSQFYQMCFPRITEYNYTNTTFLPPRRQGCTSMKFFLWSEVHIQGYL